MFVSDLCPTCAAYYGNRSACYMMMDKYTEALEDARMSLKLDSQFVKVSELFESGYFRNLHKEPVGI